MVLGTRWVLEAEARGERTAQWLFSLSVGANCVCESYHAVKLIRAQHRLIAVAWSSHNDSAAQGKIARVLYLVLKEMSTCPNNLNLARPESPALDPAQLLSHSERVEPACIFLGGCTVAYRTVLPVEPQF
jgi:hypothetical protein